jgi:hypothetical protein
LHTVGKIHIACTLFKILTRQQTFEEEKILGPSISLRYTDKLSHLGFFIIKQLYNYGTSLKLLSSEMDLAEIRFIRKTLLKREARRFLEKSARPPSCESPFKLKRHLIQLLAISKQIAMAHTFCQWPFIHYGTYSYLQRH